MLKVIVQYTGTVNPEYKERAVPVLEWTDFMRYGRGKPIFLQVHVLPASLA